MLVQTLRRLLHEICDEGYGDYVVYFCDDDDDTYTVNHMYSDDDHDICIESTDAEDETYDFTVKNILKRLRHYERDTYVYFREEYEDESSWNYDISYSWYIDDDGDLNIDCYDNDDDDDDDEY